MLAGLDGGLDGGADPMDLAGLGADAGFDGLDGGLPDLPDLPAADLGDFDPGDAALEISQLAGLGNG